MLFLSKTVLYKKDNKNMIRVWSIYVEGNELVIKHGVLNGALQEKRELIPAGKGGRSIPQQMSSRMKSRVHTQKLKGYKESIEQAQSGPTNSLGLSLPMLAQVWSKVKNQDFSDVFVQYKYDGNRCLIASTPEGLIAYSRNGKVITTIDHILDEIYDLPVGTALDGELYIHNAGIVTNLNSLIKKKQPQTKNLQFHAYDLISHDIFWERYKQLKSLDLGSNIMVAPTWHISKMGSIKEGLTTARTHNYEGLILRTNDTPYEKGKRSKSLMKVKAFLDDEFTVTNIVLSSADIPVLHCITDKGKQFKVTAPGSFAAKQQIYENKANYIGQKINVEFASLTPDGKPFQPIATKFRAKEEE